MRGKWTVPGSPWPSAHLIHFVAGPGWPTEIRARCGRSAVEERAGGIQATDEPPATGKTCESCLRLSRRDG